MKADGVRICWRTSSAHCSTVRLAHGLPGQELEYEEAWRDDAMSS